MKLDLIKLKNEYLEYVKATLSDGTYRCYYHHLSVILNFFINNNLEINKNNLIKYIQESKNNKLSNNTINHRVLCLKCMIKFFNIDNDVLTVKKLKVIDLHFDYLNNGKIDKLRDYIKTSSIKVENKLALALLIDTGVRLRELINIEIKNIDFDNRIILLSETKSKKTRYVFYTEFIDQYFNLVDLNKDKLFNITESGVYKIFVRANKVLKFKQFHPHMLRHSCATNLLKNGADLESVRQILGHSSLRQTQRYLHFDITYVKSVYDKCMK